MLRRSSGLRRFCAARRVLARVVHQFTLRDHARVRHSNSLGSGLGALAKHLEPSGGKVQPVGGNVEETPPLDAPLIHECEPLDLEHGPVMIIGQLCSPDGPSAAIGGNVTAKRHDARQRHSACRCIEPFFPARSVAFVAAELQLWVRNPPTHGTLMNGFAKRVYTIAGVYGLIVMLPQYFLEERIGRDTPPPITHPEYFYGFIGIVLVWQLAFLVIARDPARFRALMPVTVLEKLVFAVPVVVLFAQGRVAPTTVVFAALDLVLGTLFLLAYSRTVPSAA